VAVQVALGHHLHQRIHLQLVFGVEAQLLQALLGLGVVHGRAHTAPAVDDASHPFRVGIDVLILVDPAVMNIQHHRRQVGDLQAVIQPVGFLVVLEGDAVARHLRQARPDGAGAFHPKAAGDVHVALEVLELSTVAHHADHIGVVFKFGQAVFHHAGILRAQHAVLAGMERQADVRRPCQLADGGKPLDQLLFDGRVLVHRRHLGVTVERQQIAAQTQHAQGRRQFGDIGQQAQLGGQVVSDHFHQLVAGHLRRDAVHPAQRGGARIEGALDQLQGTGGQQALGMSVLARKADAGVGHGVAWRKQRME